MTIIYVDSVTGSNANAGTLSTAPKATVFLTTGIGSGGNPAFTAASVGDRIVVRRIHGNSDGANPGREEIFASGTSVAITKSGMTTFLQTISIEAHDNSVDSIATWNSDSTSLKPLIQRLDTSTDSNSFLNPQTADMKIWFKNIEIKRSNSVGASTGPLIANTATNTNAMYFCFTGCTLTCVDNTNNGATQSAIFQFNAASARGALYFKSCTLSFPTTCINATSNTGNPSLYIFEDCTLDFRVSSGNSSVLLSDADPDHPFLVLRRCSLAPGSAAVQNIIRTSATTTANKHFDNLVVENCVGLPAIGNAFSTFQQYMKNDYEVSSGIVYAGVEADPETHQYFSHSYKIERITTAGDLRVGGSTSIQKITAVTISGSQWANTLSKDNPYQRQVNHWVFKMDSSNVCKCSIYVKEKNFSTAPKIQGKDATLYFTVEYISNLLSPFTITKVDSSDETYVATSLVSNTWTELFATLIIPPAALNGFMRIRLFSNLFDTNGELYVEPDIILTS